MCGEAHGGRIEVLGKPAREGGGRANLRRAILHAINRVMRQTVRGRRCRADRIVGKHDDLPRKPAKEARQAGSSDMKPLTGREIRGTWATLLIPINDDESINYAKLSDEIDYLIAAEVDGIYSNGTAGEFYAQGEDEFDRISQLLAEKCERAGMAFQIGASFMSAQIALDRARRAAELKPGAIQVILPDWSPVTLAEATAFLQRVAEAVALAPLVLYNPPHAKRVLQPRELASLCEAVPPLAGVKVAGGDEDWYAAMGPLLPRLSVFVPGHLLASGFAQGAHGAYSNVACLQPRGAQRWNELMKTNLAAALDIEGRIRKFMNDHLLPFREKYGASNQALDKLLAAVGNWAPVGTRLRWPYRGVDETEAAALRPVARRMIPELFADD